MKHKRKLGEKFTTNESAGVRLRRHMRGETVSVKPRTPMDLLRTRVSTTTLVLPSNYWGRKAP